MAEVAGKGVVADAESVAVISDAGVRQPITNGVRKTGEAMGAAGDVLERRRKGVRAEDVPGKNIEQCHTARRILRAVSFKG